MIVFSAGAVTVGVMPSQNRDDLAKIEPILVILQKLLATFQKLMVILQSLLVTLQNSLHPDYPPGHIAKATVSAFLPKAQQRF